MVDIENLVKELIKKYKTNDPKELCELNKIWVYYVPLGKIKGHYTYKKRKKAFFINENLNPLERKFCLAHELGHALIHPKSNFYFNKNYTMVVQEKYEKQADKFAAELLIESDLLMEYEGYSLKHISKATNIELKYLELKFNKINCLHNG